MTEIKVEIVQMPSAEEMRNFSEIRREEIEKSYRERRERNLALAKNDLPKFLKYVNEKIEIFASNGAHHLDFSFDDSNFSDVRDERCLYTFPGSFDYSLAKEIEEIYEKCGFICHCKDFGNSYYRTGHISLDW